MVWIPLANGDGQVVKGIKLKDPTTGKTHTVVSTSRKGINRYEITFDDGSKVFNHEIRKKKSSPGWEVVGRFHTPEEISRLYGRKLDPDANLPRPMRASFWKMKSKPGTHNYKQKKKLMQDPVYIKKFSQFFKDTLDESVGVDEGFKNWSFELKPGDKTKVLSGDHRGKRGVVVSSHEGGSVYTIKHPDGSTMKHHISTLEEPIREEYIEEGPKDAAGKDVFVKKIAKSAGVDYEAAGAIAAAAGRKRLGKAKFQKRVEAGQKAAAKARSQGKKYTGEHN